VHQLGVQLRDLRLLDPHLNTSYPSALLCRDKALVVNLEHIKCIITKDEVFIVNADEESVVRAPARARAPASRAL
jgi:magnesium transporter